MRVYVALLASALFITAGLAGCSGKKDKGTTDSHSSSSAAAALPVLLMNVTIGNHSYAFSSASSAVTSVTASASGSRSGPASGNASASASGSSSGSKSGSGSASGSSTAAAANVTGNASIPTGKAPLNVTFILGAKNVKAAATAKWTFDFGRAGGANATKANATSKVNATANATAANGTKLPATLNHTYMAQGDYNVTFILRVGNATPQSLRATLHILANATASNGTATKALPAETHFEFGESLGCTGDLPPAGAPPVITCIDFQSGPPGSDTDGHWITLGAAYVGLMVSSTVGTNPDSDCVFTDADGAVIGDASNGGDPCGGAAVPEGSEYLFVYPYGAPATSITVDFTPA